ncbi:hypothetical protein ABG067_003056 [Albugo candida]
MSYAKFDAMTTTNRLEQLQHKNFELDGLVQIIKSKLAQVEEENFELCANIATVEAEKQYEIKKSQDILRKENHRLTSELEFLKNQYQHTQREKKPSTCERSAFRKERIEKQRLDAEKKRAEAQKRKHDSSFASSSQTPGSDVDRNYVWVAKTSQQPVSAINSLHRSGMKNIVATEIQANPADLESIDEIIMQENMELITAFMTLFSTDLLALFDIPHVELDACPGKNEHTSSLVPEDSSRSVFTQVTEHAKAKFKSWVTEHSNQTFSMQANVLRNCAKHFYEVLGMMMMKGELSSSVALLPVFIRYFDSRVDIDPHVLSSAFRLLCLVILKSKIFQNFLAEDNNVDYSQIDEDKLRQSNTGIRDAVDDRAEMIQKDAYDPLVESFSRLRRDPYIYPTDTKNGVSHEERAQLMEAICRVIKIHSTSVQVVDQGLRCLSSWVHCVHEMKAAPMSDYKRLLHSHILQDIILGPKSFPRSRAQALELLADLITIKSLFPNEFEQSAQQNLFFNRCANLLRIPSERGAPCAQTAIEILGGSDSKVFQGVISLFLRLVLHHPVSGIRFVLLYTRGDDRAEESSSFFTLVLQFMKYYITLLEDAAETSNFEWTKSNTIMVEDAFQLLNIMIPHIQFDEELSIGNHEYDFFICLRFLLESENHFSTFAVKSASLQLERLSRYK